MTMRVGILTAGGDTPALNATIYGAVERASQLEIEMVGIVKGFEGILREDVPHVRLNPLFQSIPELDPMRGGTLLGGFPNLHRSRTDRVDESRFWTAGETRARWPDLHWRRWDDQRNAAVVGVLSLRLGSQND